MKLTDSLRKQDREQWWDIHDKETYICPDCGRSGDKVEEWDVHHIDGEPGKIVGLCATCHQVRHGATRWRIDLQAWKEAFLAEGAGNFQPEKS